MNYYILVDQKRLPGRWYLKGPSRSNGQVVDPRTFTAGESVNVDTFGTLFISLRRPGTPLEFTLADFDMPVATEELAAALLERCAGELQLIPTRVEGSTKKYAILNLTQVVQCLDEERSGVTWWTPAEGRPEKLGQYMIVAHPRIDSTRVRGQRIFRIKGWENVVVVSEEIVDLFSSRIGPVLQPA